MSDHENKVREATKAVMAQHDNTLRRLADAPASAGPPDARDQRCPCNYCYCGRVAAPSPSAGSEWERQFEAAIRWALDEIDDFPLREPGQGATGGAPSYGSAHSAAPAAGEPEGRQWTAHLEWSRKMAESQPAPAQPEMDARTALLQHTVYAWLGFWRDKVPAEAVAQLQSVLGPLARLHREQEGKLVFPSGEPAPAQPEMDAMRLLHNCLLVLPEGDFKREVEGWLAARLHREQEGT